MHCVPQNVPPDLSVCSFVLAQCLSVRALQEMLANREDQAAGVSSQLGSHSSLTIMDFCKVMVHGCVLIRAVVMLCCAGWSGRWSSHPPLRSCCTAHTLLQQDGELSQPITVSLWRSKTFHFG